jgi:site-specific DNA recombinase
MLTVAYCRVSTNEQAEEGFSIEGQAEKMRAYSDLHDLGEVTVITDPGLSGKDLKRPGLQQLLTMVDAGHVSTVLTWRLDRLSRNLSDLILLADRFGQADVALHSFSEKIDLSSATGRMFYNVLGSFAQFYREQLAENVKMGMSQAMREGRWCNRPPTGYDLLDGMLVPNDKAPTVQRIFLLRAEGMSQSKISAATGVNHSTVLSILKNRAYLGEISNVGNWLPGKHQPLVTVEEFEAVTRGRVRGRRRGSDLMSGRVSCGLCFRPMSISDNGRGHKDYRCKHRGEGCSTPARSNRGVLKAALLGLRLLTEDKELQEAIRQELDAGRRNARQGDRSTAPASAKALETLTEQRRKLLALHYDGLISADQFGEEQARLTIEIDTLRDGSRRAAEEATQAFDLADRFDQVATLLQELNIDSIWHAATEQEQRTLLDELIESVVVLPDHLEVTIHGAPTLNVLPQEVGLQPVEIGGVGGGTDPLTPRPALTRSWPLAA